MSDFRSIKVLAFELEVTMAQLHHSEELFNRKLWFEIPEEFRWAIGGAADTFDPRENLERIQGITATRNDIGLILLGHNRDKGLQVAPLIHEHLRAKTIVLQNWGRNASDSYRAFGFSRFCTRGELEKEVIRMLDEGVI